MNNNHKFSTIALAFALLVSTVAGAQEVPVNKLRGPRQWNPQTKGAVIGGATGAAAGAIINKRNRVVGGVIGGAVGAGAGYAIGKRIDNKRKAAAALAARRAEEERIAEARRQDRIAYGEANRSMRASNGQAPALGTAAATHSAAAVAAGAASVNRLAPAPQTAYVTDMGYLLNPFYGDQSTAYPESEVRRKSW